MSFFAAGEVLGDYRIVRLLGQGGMGEVYEAVASDGTHVALKVFSAERGARGFLRERFLVEGRLLLRLSHPRLVRVRDVGVDAQTDRPFYAMDLVLRSDGNPQTLEDARAAGTVTEELAEGWYADLCAALAYCHAEGVVHRDVKPGNVLIDVQGRAVLSDFGVSRVFDPEVRSELQVMTTFVEGETTGTRPVMGTYWFLAPEVRKGGEATAASDWYALGMTFFRLLTGLWYEPGTQAFDLLAPYDERWRARLERLLAEDPAVRSPETAAPVGRPVLERRRRFIFGILGVVLAIFATSAFLWLRTDASLPRVLSEATTLAFDDATSFDFCPCAGGTNVFEGLTVVVTHPYALGTVPVTRRQWFAVCGEPLSSWPGGEEAPMTYVTRTEVTNFCARLTARFADRLPAGYEIRLPTLAEWRLAYARGEPVEEKIDDESKLRKVCEKSGWFGQSANGHFRTAGMRRYYEGLGRPAPMVTNIWKDFPPQVLNPGKDDWERNSSEVPPVPVGLRPPNGMGLKDMLGNCFERVEDTCSKRALFWGLTEWGGVVRNLYRMTAPVLTNPVLHSGTYPLMVGGYMTPGIRGDRPWMAPFERLPHLGFRLCLGPKIKD